jgi:hypothetical protein
MSDRKLLESYNQATMQELYDAHLKMSSRCQPPRTTLATRLADFGEGARSYAIYQVTGDPDSFDAASSVTAAVTYRTKTACTPAELDHLVKAANGLRVSQNSRALFVKRAYEVCSP